MTEVQVSIPAATAESVKPSNGGSTRKHLVLVHLPFFLNGRQADASRVLHQDTRNSDRLCILTE